MQYLYVQTPFARTRVAQTWGILESRSGWWKIHTRVCVRESVCSAFSLEFIYINNTSGNKTPRSLLLVVPREFCCAFFQDRSINFTSERFDGVRNVSSRGSTEAVAGPAPRVPHATAASAKTPLPVTDEFISWLPCPWPGCMGLAGGEQGVIFMKRGLGAFLAPSLRPVPFPREL